MTLRTRLHGTTSAAGASALGTLASPLFSRTGDFSDLELRAGIYVTDGDEIYVIDPDGSTPIQVTNDAVADIAQLDSWVNRPKTGVAEGAVLVSDGGMTYRFDTSVTSPAQPEGTWVPEEVYVGASKLILAEIVGDEADVTGLYVDPSTDVAWAETTEAGASISYTGSYIRLSNVGTVGAEAQLEFIRDNSEPALQGVYLRFYARLVGWSKTTGRGTELTAAQTSSGEIAFAPDVSATQRWKIEIGTNQSEVVIVRDAGSPLSDWHLFEAIIRPGWTSIDLFVDQSPEPASILEDAATFAEAPGSGIGIRLSRSGSDDVEGSLDIRDYTYLVWRDA